MKQQMHRYVAFLRGINVGGSKTIKMHDLKEAFASIGFPDAKTILASGNVLFGAADADPRSLQARIEAGLARALGHEASVVVRGLDELRALADADPFVQVKTTPETRRYVTFLKQPAQRAARMRSTSPDGAFAIVRATPREVCSSLELSPGRQTTELMSYLEKELGSDVTTRNWNTIEKILKA